MLIRFSLLSCLIITGIEFKEGQIWLAVIALLMLLGLRLKQVMKL